MDDELDLFDYLNKVKENWIAATTAFLIVFLLVLAYTFTARPVYESKSLVMVTSTDQAGFLLGSYNTPKIDLETQKLLIQSPNVMYPLYQEFPPYSFTFAVNIVKNSNVLEISVQANSSENAAYIANKIAELYVNYTKDQRKQDALEITSFINDQIEVYKKELDAQNVALLKYTKLKNMTLDQQLEQQAIQREINAKNKIYDYLLNKREEASLAGNVRSVNIKVLSYADLPLEPTSPKVPLNILLGLVLGGVAAIGAVFLIEQAKEEEGLNLSHVKKRK